jgi:hypothetical protein
MDRLPWKYAGAADITTDRVDYHRDAHFENVVSQWMGYPKSMLKQLIPPGPQTELIANEMPDLRVLSLKGSTTSTMY